MDNYVTSLIVLESMHHHQFTTDWLHRVPEQELEWFLLVLGLTVDDESCKLSWVLP